MLAPCEMISLLGCVENLHVRCAVGYRKRAKDGAKTPLCGTLVTRSNACQFYYYPILSYFPWNILMAFHMKILVALEVEFIPLQNVLHFLRTSHNN